MSPVYQSLVHALLWFALIFALTAGALAVARRMRGRTVQSALDPNELMTNFRELYEQGGLSEEEFRTIKAKLARELKGEQRPEFAEKTPQDARDAG